MLTFQQSYEKAQHIAGDTTADTLTQIKQDINLGYKRFNNAIARYFTRKQQFADIVEDQQYYQIPVDALRVSIVTVSIPNGYVYPVMECRSEWEWRQLNMVPSTASNYAQYYFVLGNDQLGLWPIPSQDISQGLRYVYQPQDVDLTKDDYSTGTVSIDNDSVTVTGVGTTWDQTMVDMYFSVTDGTDGNWYEILSVNSSTSITLKTPYAGPTASGTTYILGQLFIFPSEYNDVPIDYALARYFEALNNNASANYYRKNYQDMVDDAVMRYASSSTSNVITEDVHSTNPWLWPPNAGA